MKARFNIITFLFFVLIVNKASAQSSEIKGKITDLKTGENLVGVHITIKDDVHGTITGSDGNFVLKIQIQTPFIIHVSYVGYVPLDIVVDNTSEILDIRMEEQFLARAGSCNFGQSY